MAKKGFTIYGPYVSINSIDMSLWVKSIDLPISASEIDSTTGTTVAAQATAAMARLAGFKDWEFSPTFAQDFASGGPDATLFPLIGTEFAVAIRPTNAAQSSTNPTFAGNGMLFNYDPINGAINTHAETKPTIKCSDGVAMTRTAT